MSNFEKYKLSTFQRDLPIQTSPEYPNIHEELVKANGNSEKICNIIKKYRDGAVGENMYAQFWYGYFFDNELNYCCMYYKQEPKEILNYSDLAKKWYEKAMNQGHIQAKLNFNRN